MFPTSAKRFQRSNQSPCHSALESLEPRLMMSADNGLRAVYFDNIDLTTAKLCRTDTSINFDWTSGSPDATRIASDTFSARWTGKIKAANYSGSYTFYLDTESYDGVRLKINGKTIIDNWTTPDGSTSKSGTYTMSANETYDIQLDYKEDTNNAKAILSWSYGTQAKQVIPTGQLFLGEEGLRADYFNDASLTASTWKYNRSEAVNFNWGSGSPDPVNLNADGFSVRWSGQIIPQYTETYTIKAYVDEGARLWVNGTLLQDTWSAGGNVSGTVSLTAGTPASIILEYKDTTGNASARLVWSSASLAETTISDAQMYPYLPAATIMPNGPTTANKASTSLGGQYSYDSATDTYTFIGSWENLNTATLGALTINSPNANTISGVYQQVDDITIKVDHSTVRSVTNGIRWGGYSFLRLNVANTSGYGLNPNVYGQAQGIFVSAGDIDILSVTNCYSEQLGGVTVNNGGPNHAANPTITINNNFVKNVNGQKSDGNGGYVDFNILQSINWGTGVRTNMAVGFAPRSFVQLMGCGNLNCEIAWNQVINEAGKSRPEDTINLWFATGTSSSNPIRIHDNYIQGSYTMNPWKTDLQLYTGSDSNYNTLGYYDSVKPGGGLNLADGYNASGSIPCSAYVECYNNILVDSNICAPSGHDIIVHDNKITSSGYLYDGSQIQFQYGNGIGFYNEYGGPYTNNYAYNNQVGWYRLGVAHNYDSTHANPMSLWVNNTTFVPTYIMQLTEYSNWRNKLASNGKLVGPVSGTRPNVAVWLDFESGSGYNLATGLARDGSDNSPAGMDGWTSISTGQTGGSVVTNPSSKTGNQVAQGNIYAWRNVKYGFTGTETGAEATFYSYATNSYDTGSVYLNTDKIKFGSYNGTGFNFQDANGTQTSSSIAQPLNQWVQLRLLMDFTANTNAGSASMFYRIDTNGNARLDDEAWIAIAGLQNINMNMGTNNRPTTWNTIRIRSGGTGGYIDDVSVNPTSAPSSKVQIAAYTFESPTYTLSGTVSPNDGWAKVTADGVIASNPSAKWGSQVARSVYASHAISYGFTGSETAVEATFMEYMTDLYNAPKLLLGNSGMGKYVSFGSYGSVFQLTNAANTTTSSSVGPTTGQWYQLRLLMDFTANSGNGAGSVYYRTDINGDGDFANEAWVAVAGLQNINLQLSSASLLPTTWNAIRLRADGTNGYVDDIHINKYENTLAGTMMLMSAPATSLTTSSISSSSAVATTSNQVIDYYSSAKALAKSTTGSASSAKSAIR